MPQDTPRGTALNYIPQLIEEGLANTQIVNFLRAQGYGYRTQNMFADVNRVRLENFGASFIPSLGPDAPVPDRLMRTWEGNVEYAYRVVVKYDYVDANTGQEIRSGTTLYFDRPPSQEDVREAWQARRGFIEGFYGGVAQVIGETNVMYFRNVTPRGGGS